MAHRLEEQPRDLYAIPISSSWFSWELIHETERQSLPEFFNHSSYSRNPRVYKEYRDFIINKFREQPTRRLRFTEVRKSLIGDVGSLEKVFKFLDKWGLINFGVEDSDSESKGCEDKVVVEEGPPIGVKVVPACSNLVGHGGGSGDGVRDGGFRFAGLSSYVDVFGESMGLSCGHCGDKCESEQVGLIKGAYTVCSKCSKNEYENKGGMSMDDSSTQKYTDDSNSLKSTDDSNSQKTADNNTADLTNTTAWTDPETLLLLEAVLKHGEDWDLIAQHVRTKTKSECIARIISLPLGNHMLSHAGNKMVNFSKNSGSSELAQATSIDIVKEQYEELPMNIDEEEIPISTENKKVDEEASPERPSKRICLPSLSEVTESLMEQVALLSTVSGPHIAAAAAEAAVAALSNENPCAQYAFDTSENVSLSSKDDMESDPKYEDQDMMKHTIKEPSVEKSFGTTTYRIRAAIATALGSAAARAKLLADQELREMELLIASIIETQVKKIKIKMKHFEELEHIMEEEHSLIQQIKVSTIEEWVNLLQDATRSGDARWKDNGLPKLLINTNL